MHDFSKSNRISNILWLKTSIDHLTFKIKLKPREGVVTFPKYNEYVNTTSTELPIQQTVHRNELCEYTFKWQEKVFSRWEFNQYLDVNNCILEKEIEYNNKIQNNDYNVSRMFTYIDTGAMLSMPKLYNKDNKKNYSLEVSSCFSNLNAIVSLSNNDSSTRHLFESEEDINSDDEQWEAMHIIWDNSDYNEESQLLFKEECVLLSLHYNTTNGCLLVSPSENDIDHNPYNVITKTAGVLGFEYSIEIEDDDKDGEELVTLLNKLNTKLERKQKSILSFEMPPLGKTKTFVNFEIVSAKAFDMDNFYIEFTVKIPEEISCNGDVHGRTHVSKAIETEGTREWKFGHTMSFELEYANGLDPLPLTIYLEAISTDWWCRHRTEGYAYVTLTSEPGKHSKYLSCRRPEELDRREADRRRFFVGECHLLKDLSVLDHPQDFDVNFRYVTTGDISVRWNTMTQAHRPGTVPSVTHGSALQLLQGADAALRQYKKAKATLASATEDLDIIYGSGDG